MKKLIVLMLASMLMAAQVSATEVPEPVTKAFQQNFPGAKKVKWENENNKTEFEVSFELNGKEMSAVYSPEGHLKETETKIPAAELPQAVTEALLKMDPEVKIIDAERIEKADKMVFYETEVKIKGKKTELTFDENGNEQK